MKFNTLIWFAIVAIVALAKTEAAPVDETPAVASNQASASQSIAAEAVQTDKVTEAVAAATAQPAAMPENAAATVEGAHVAAVQVAAVESVATENLTAITASLVTPQANPVQAEEQVVVAAESVTQPAGAVVADHIPAQPEAPVLVPAVGAAGNEIKSEVNVAVAEVVAQGSLDEVKVNKAENETAAPAAVEAAPKVEETKAEEPKTENETAVEDANNEQDSEADKVAEGSLERFIIHIYQPLPRLPQYWRNGRQRPKQQRKFVGKIPNGRSKKPRQGAIMKNRDNNRRKVLKKVLPAQSGKPKAAQNVQGKPVSKSRPAMARKVAKRQEPLGWNRVFKMAVQPKNMQRHVRTKRA